MKAPSPPSRPPVHRSVPVPPPSGGGPTPARRVSPPASGHEGVEWSRRRSRRVWVVGFAVSAVVHLVAILLYSEIDVRFGEMDAAIDPDAAAPVDGMEVVNLQEPPADELDAPSQPEETLVAPQVTADIPLVSGPIEERPPTISAPPPGLGVTAADRLRPATYEEDLWIPLVPEAVTLSDQELLQSVIYSQLQAFNDSMAIRAAREASGTDWTYTDEEGNRWGISPGKIHLGRFTIPLPFSFGSPVGASDDLNDRLMMQREIDRAAGLLEADATIEERAAAIRERIDAARSRRAAPDSTGGGGGDG